MGIGIDMGMGIGMGMGMGIDMGMGMGIVYVKVYIYMSIGSIWVAIEDDVLRGIVKSIVIAIDVTIGNVSI